MSAAISCCCVVVADVGVAVRCVGVEGEDTLESWICVNRALYRPRCRPDGDVVVDSRHEVKRPRNCSIVMSTGRMSRSVAAWQASKSAAHCGVDDIVARAVYLD
jgi:hypothetical protein